MASKNPSANGRACASAWMGNTRSSTPASRIRPRLSLAAIHRSTAHTCRPYSFARNMELNPLPQPMSSTRMPGRRSIHSARDSVNHRAFGPIMLSRTQFGSYFAERGNSARRNESSCPSSLPCTTSSPSSRSRKPERSRPHASTRVTRQARLHRTPCHFETCCHFERSREISRGSALLRTNAPERMLRAKARTPLSMTPHPGHPAHPCK